MEVYDRVGTLRAATEPRKIVTVIRRRAVGLRLKVDS